MEQHKNAMLPQPTASAASAAPAARAARRSRAESTARL